MGSTWGPKGKSSLAVGVKDVKTAFEA